MTSSQLTNLHLTTFTNSTHVIRWDMADGGKVPKSTWIRKNVMRAKLFEIQKIAWRIFFLERKEIDENVEREVSETCKLLLALRSIPISKLTADLKDQRMISDIVIRSPKEATCYKEKAKLLLLRSKLLKRTLRTLHLHHNSPSLAQIPLPPMTLKSSLKQSPISSLSSGCSARQREQRTCIETTHQSLQGQKEDELSTHGASLPARRVIEPSSLDSVFIGSLSQSSSRNTQQRSSLPRPKTKKNRIGQRARRLEAEKMYGKEAKHLQVKRSDRAHSARQKQLTRRQNPQKNKQDYAPSTSQGSEQLHPSWVASRKKKEMQKAVFQPQGQRTVFEDSD